MSVNPASIPSPGREQLLGEIVADVLAAVDQDQLDLTVVFIPFVMEDLFHHEDMLRRARELFDTSEAHSGFGEVDWLIYALVPMVLSSADRLQQRLAALRPEQPVPDGLIDGVITVEEVRRIARRVGSDYATDKAPQLMEVLRICFASQLGKLRELRG